MNAVQTPGRRVGVRSAAVACAAALTAIGCGPGYQVTPVTGRVTCNGKPVSIGSVSFVPVAEEGVTEPGKPAMGTLKPDGTFGLSTYAAMDGAVIGKHRVQYFGPEGEEEEDETFTAEEGSGLERAKAAERARERQEVVKSLCVQTGEIVVEVTADGPNDFTIELKPPGREVEGSSGD